MELPQSSSRRFWRPTWRTARRLSQFFLFLLFLALFRANEYAGQDALSWPVNLLFRLNPLTSLSAMLAGWTWIAALWPALLILLATLILGRFFCGWICPLGTLLDVFGTLIRPLTRRTAAYTQPPAGLHLLRFILLTAVLVGALAGFSLVGLVDPLAIFYRAATLWVDPHLYQTGRWLGDTAWSAFLRDYLLPFARRTYLLAGLSLIVLLVVLALEFLARRFWCRYLCPLGALLSLPSRWALLRRVPLATCSNCPGSQNCSESCRMAAFDAQGRWVPEDCTLCMDCTLTCPRELVRFRFSTRSLLTRPSAVSGQSVDLSRRWVLTSLALGAATPILARAAVARTSHRSTLPAHFLRPPGVLDEERFRNLCVRCGLCLKVCPTGGLQPAALQAGFDALFSPHLVPRIGYCEYGCTLCSQVCPTGAIPRLSESAKHQVAIGKAVIDTTRCLPWAHNQDCLCCEEHCPLPRKAIERQEVAVTTPDGQTFPVERPHVNLDRCIGCGICEYVCPLDGPAAIRVVRRERLESLPAAPYRQQ